MIDAQPSTVPAEVLSQPAPIETVTQEDDLKKRITELQGGDDVKYIAHKLLVRLRSGELTSSEYEELKQLAIDATSRVGSTTADIFRQVEAVPSADEIKKRADELVAQLAREQNGISVEEYLKQKNELLNLAFSNDIRTAPAMIAASESKYPSVMAKLYEPQSSPGPVEPQRIEQKSLPDEYREKFKIILAAGDERFLIPVVVNSEGNVVLDPEQVKIMTKIKEAFKKGENVTFSSEENLAAEAFFARLDELSRIATERENENKKLQEDLQNSHQSGQIDNLLLTMKAAFGGGKNPLLEVIVKALDPNTTQAKKRDELLAQSNTTEPFSLREVLTYAIKRTERKIVEAAKNPQAKDELEKLLKSRDALAGTFLGLQKWSMDLGSQKIDLDTPINDDLLNQLKKK